MRLNLCRRIRMRLRGLLVVLCAALALTACVRQQPRYVQANGQVPMSQATLDMRSYGAPQPQTYTAQRTYVAQQPPSYVVQRAAQAVPVAAATYDEGPYTLDAGDKLRIVVF